MPDSAEAASPDRMEVPGPYVDYDEQGSVAVITLNRPERRNSLSRALVRDLDAAWMRFESSRARVAVYTGAGSAFCSGMDVKEAIDRPAAEADRPEPPLTRFHAGEVTKPVIAAVNGHAVGGGFFDVLRCDLRIAAEGAVFQFTEVHRSVLPLPIFDGIAGPVPDCVLSELALGFPIGAERALELGLVNRVVPRVNLLPTAFELADNISQLPPLAVAAILDGLRRFRRGTSDVVAKDRWKLNVARTLTSSHDYTEAVGAFIEKRQPRFEGR